MLTEKKKILVFADWYDPGYKAGGPIRSCVNFAENMKSEQEIFVFTSDRDLGEDQPYPGINSDTWLKLNGINLLYGSSSYLTLKNITRNIKKISPDYIYINSMYSRYFALYPLLIKRLGLTDSTVVLAPRGMLKKTALRFKGTKKKLFLFLFKLLGFQKAITFHATDSTEEIDIQRIFGANVKCRQVSNFPSPQQPGIQHIDKQVGVLKVIFVGRIHPIKNLALLLNYIGFLQSAVILTIVGVIEDELYWNECKKKIDLFSPNIQVIFKKDIPHKDIGNLIADHHIFALPTEGENFGHAIFEALSFGRAVLISDQTPWRNLQPIKAGWDLPLSNSKAFIDVLNEAANMDNEIFLQWCRGAWQLAGDYIVKTDIKAMYLKLFN